MTIETPNLNDEIEVTPEQYQAFHDEARDSGAYAWRGWSLLIGMSLVAVGSLGLYALKPWGPRLASLGATVALIGGSVGGFDSGRRRGGHGGCSWTRKPTWLWLQRHDWSLLGDGGHAPVQS